MKKLTTLFLAIIMTTGLFAQNLTGKISGTVSSDGQPLVGANVIIEGTSTGAATDENGTYYVLMSNLVYTPCVLIISDTNLKLYLTYVLRLD